MAIVMRRLMSVRGVSRRPDSPDDRRRLWAGTVYAPRSAVVPKRCVPWLGRAAS
jgi:hypothetical protein